MTLKRRTFIALGAPAVLSISGWFGRAGADLKTPTSFPGAPSTKRSATRCPKFAAESKAHQREIAAHLSNSR